MQKSELLVRLSKAQLAIQTWFSWFTSRWVSQTTEKIKSKNLGIFRIPALLRTSLAIVISKTPKKHNYWTQKVLQIKANCRFNNASLLVRANQCIMPYPPNAGGESEPAADTDRAASCQFSPSPCQSIIGLLQRLKEKQMTPHTSCVTLSSAFQNGIFHITETSNNVSASVKKKSVFLSISLNMKYVMMSQFVPL